MRIIRLYPLYLLGTAIGWVCALVGIEPFASLVPPEWMPLAVPLSLVMAPIFVGVVNFPFDAPAWSLFFEMLANGGFALFHRQLAKPVWLISGLVLFAALLAVVIHRFGSAALGWQADKHALGGAARVGFSFLAGLGIHALHKRWPLRLGFRPWLLALALLALVLAPPHEHHGAYDLISILVVMPLLLYVGAGLTPGRREGQIFSFLGGVSYAIYATHGPLAFALEGPFESNLPLTFTLPKLALGFGFMVFAALLGYAANRWYDEPVRRILTRWERDRAQPEAQPARA